MLKENDLLEINILVKELSLGLLQCILKLMEITTLEFSQENRELLKRDFTSKFSQNTLVWIGFYGDLSNKGEVLTPNHTHTSLFRDNLLVKISF